MASSEPKVSIVIPNRDGATPRNGLTYLEMVMRTLAEQSFRDFEVIVVDNGSSDDSVGYLRESWPDVRTVELGENRGFSAAVNAGIAAGRGPYVALLNTDIELSPDWLELLVGEFERDPRLGFATGKVMRYDDRDVIEQAGHDFFVCGRFEPRGLDERDEGQYDERRATPIVTAAAAVYGREALDQAGGFDEDYFLYCEDGDVCLRMLLLGYSGLYVPEPKAFHVRGGTVGAAASDLPRFFLVRNALITLLKDLPASVLLRSLPKIALYHWGQFSAARKEGYARRVLQAYTSFLRMIPATLRKRRAVQSGRSISPAEFASQVRTDYPFPTRLARLLP
jgi:GT2 family glycosyltransferase